MENFIWQKSGKIEKRAKNVIFFYFLTNKWNCITGLYDFFSLISRTEVFSLFKLFEGQQFPLALVSPNVQNWIIYWYLFWKRFVFKKFLSIFWQIRTMWRNLSDISGKTRKTLTNDLVIWLESDNTFCLSKRWSSYV